MKIKIVLNLGRAPKGQWPAYRNGQVVNVNDELGQFLCARRWAAPVADNTPLTESDPLAFARAEEQRNAQLRRDAARAAAEEAAAINGTAPVAAPTSTPVADSQSESFSGGKSTSKSK